MIHLIYTSTSSHALSSTELEDLLTVSRANNEANDITGMMLYDGGKFIQAIEGEGDVIDALYEKICNDKRNSNQILIERADTSEKVFDSWSMGYRRIDANNQDEIEGYADIFEDNQSTSYYKANAERVVRLLHSFLRYL